MRQLLAATFLAFLICPFCQAQHFQGSITGMVIDPSGAVIPKASISLSLNGKIIKALTDVHGRFFLTNIPAGQYTIHVSRDGFGTALEIVSVAPAEASSITITLNVGEPQPPPPPQPPPQPHPLPHQALPDPQWNIWEEEPYAKSPSFAPVPVLHPDTEYSLVIDLAAINLSGPPGVYNQPAGAALVQQVSEWLSKGASFASVQVLVIPDQGFFWPQGDKDFVKSLEINLDNVRKVEQSGVPVNGSGFQTLRSNPSNPLSFGYKTFRIKTREREGTASIALLIWARGIPVDEITVPVCISGGTQGETCKSARPATAGLDGIDPLRVSAQKMASRLPDGSLQFFQFDSDTLRGVFRCNSCSNWKPDEYKVWRLDETPGELSAYLSQTFIQDLETASDSRTSNAFIQHGQDLFAELFGAGGGDHDEESAREAFIAFIQSKVQANPPAGLPPSLFVRMLARNSQPMYMLPLGLMYIPISGGQSDFLGFHFRIETPLPDQNYDTPNSCISKWVLLVPGENDNEKNDPLQQLRAPYSSWISAFSAWGGGSIVDQNIAPFRDWLRTATEITDPTVILVLSHHNSNRLYFDPQDTVEVPSVVRKFDSPSLVILDACGTAQPGARGATEFVTKFNERGISAAIATALEVDATMGGDFINLFTEALSKGNGVTISQARFDAITKLRTNYGPRALIFMLAGNGDLSVCTPPAP